ncbi:MAG: hypothetical protein HRU51_10525 [Xanthomonadales bacterium]|nr:hypothetical protein [Xanthomonadales bacterium]
MPQDQGPALEQLHADLIHLMNRYSGTPCALTAAAITQLLQRILKHPLIELFPELRCQCARGLNDWRCRAAYVAPVNKAVPPPNADCTAAATLH